jgi:hypothetical protein
MVLNSTTPLDAAAPGEMSLVGFCDADYAGDNTTSRSVSGCVVLLGGSPISWFSRQQNTVAKSSMESEYYGADETISELLFLYHMLEELGYVIDTPLAVHIDNTSAIHLGSDHHFSRRARHIRVRYHRTRDLVADGTIALKYIASADQPADVMTKNVNADTLRRFIPLFFAV